MKLHLKIIYSSLLAILIIGCSKLNDNLPLEPKIGIHKTGITNPDSANFHGNLVKDLKWNMNTCKQCHGGDYSGGIAEASCLNCHVFPNGPEACNTCHGDFTNINFIAPPRDINKNTDSTFVGVGAHKKHLYTNMLGKDIPCITCHKVPQNVYDMGHVDSDLPAEIIFGELALNDLGINSSYDFGAGTCSNTYCHGNWVFYKDSSANQFIYTDSIMVGNNLSVIWNIVDGTQAPCGSCHNLPPIGHAPAQLSACATCHLGVVDTDGNIIDRTKHINGEINVFGN